MKSKMLMLAALIFVVFASAAKSAEYKLAIQPILPPAKIKEHYKPLAVYLSEVTGDKITLATFSSFKSYYANMKRKKGFDMVLDAAHFTNYRADNMGYTVLAKIPDTVTFSLVTGPDLMVFDADELIPYKVATMISPAMGGLRLKELFPNRDQSPTIVRAFDSIDAIKQVQDGLADAAMIPTPIASQYPELNVVLTTDPLPHTAFSVSPDVPQMVADAVKDALVNAINTRKGRDMLTKLKFEKFISASNDMYAGFGNILQVTKRDKPVLTNFAR